MLTSVECLYEAIHTGTVCFLHMAFSVSATHHTQRALDLLSSLSVY